MLVGMSGLCSTKRSFVWGTLHGWILECLLQMWLDALVCSLLYRLDPAFAFPELKNAIIIPLSIFTTTFPIISVDKTDL